MNETEKMLDSLSQQVTQMVGKLNLVNNDLNGRIDKLQAEVEEIKANMATKDELNELKANMATKDDIKVILSAIEQLAASIGTISNAQAAVELTAYRTAADVAALKLVK